MHFMTSIISQQCESFNAGTAGRLLLLVGDSDVRDGKSSTRPPGSSDCSHDGELRGRTKKEHNDGDAAPSSIKGVETF